MSVTQKKYLQILVQSLVSLNTKANCFGRHGETTEHLISY